MARKNSKLVQELERINDEFDKAHYLEVKSRPIRSLFEILRFKSVQYKRKINRAQVEIGNKEGFKIRLEELVACTIAGKIDKAYSLGTSYKVLSKPDPRMAKLVKALGKLGERSSFTGSRNIIGKCAEVKAANRLFLVDRHATVEHFEFTSAIRPRTMEKIPRCPNCVHMFGPEK